MFKKVLFFLVFLLIPFGGFAQAQDAILATVGSEKISEKYIDEMWNNLPEPVRKRYGDERQVKEKMLNHVIETKIFAYGARQIKLDKKESIKARMQNMMDELLAREYLAHLKASMTIDEKEMNEYYKEHGDLFRSPEKVKLRHMALDNRKEAEAVLLELRNGADFGEIAAKQSIDPTGKKGGDLGWVARGATQPEIEEIAFKLKKGEISDVIKSDTGYHIIKVDDRKEARDIPLKDVKARVEYILRQKKEGRLISDERKRLKKELDVEIFVFPTEASDKKGN